MITHVIIFKHREKTGRIIEKNLKTMALINLLRFHSLHSSSINQSILSLQGGEREGDSPRRTGTAPPGERGLPL